MIKLVYCLRRQSHLSRREFQQYWLETHGPLVRARAEALRIRRYVQVHTMDGGPNEALRASRGCADEAFDGVAELWWEGVETLGSGNATEDGRKAARELLEDEERFIDFERSVIFVGEEQAFVGD